MKCSGKNTIYDLQLHKPSGKLLHTLGLIQLRTPFPYFFDVVTSQRASATRASDISMSRACSIASLRKLFTSSTSRKEYLWQVLRSFFWPWKRSPKNTTKKRTCWPDLNFGTNLSIFWVVVSTSMKTSLARMEIFPKFWGENKNSLM